MAVSCGCSPAASWSSPRCGHGAGSSRSGGVAHGDRPGVDTPFALDLEADVAVQPDGVLVLALHPEGERGRTARAKIGERVQQERAAEPTTALGAGHGDL